MPNDSAQDRGERLAVLGAGGHAGVVIGVARLCGYEDIVVYDDDAGKLGAAVCGAEVRGPIASAVDDGPAAAVVAIGDNHRRLALAESLDLRWTTLVHPSAVVDATATLGPGAQVMAGAVVQAGALVGAQAIINTNAIVEHDCRIEDGAHVSCGACLAGAVRLGHASLVGVNASVLPGVTVGESVTLGAGAVAIGDLPDGVVAVGVPARVIRGGDQTQSPTRLKA